MRIDEKLTDYVVEQVVRLAKTPSLAGHTDEAITCVEQELDRIGVKHRRTGRGALLVTLEGRDTGNQRALTAHVDTLGAMVRELGKDGSLLFTAVGGYALATVEGEYVTVETASGKRLRGTILFEEPSAHVSKKVHDTKREFENMRIRLDAEVRTAKDLAKLGIAVGDYVHFDPRCEVTDTGFVKTRHLDDKAGVACLLGALKALSDAKARSRLTTHFLFSTSEEVGFGASAGIPHEVTELVAVDMGAVGKGQESDEYSVCICAKDSTGPFDYALRQRLLKLCRTHKIPHKVDVYPFYGSDAAVAVRAGLDAVTGLIGPGINASHNLERTHRKALAATVRLILAYVAEEK
ncbi:M42 family metallopeptidase [candidate division WOR-3 bacterium]|nr:M42 family metallopeptidase [candidate division WOR-3 bacterium]